MNEAAAPPLLFDVNEGVAKVILNRPHEGNAMAPEMLTALEDTWNRVNDDPEIRVVLITGAGDRHFCTGASVAQLQVGKGSLNNVSHMRANRFTPQQMHVTKPVICLVNGLCNGGGLHFVAEADVVIAHEDVQFMDTHVSVGQVSALESLGVARRAGVGAALLMGLAGQGFRLSASRAYQLGLIDLLEDTREAALARAESLASIIAQNSPQAMALTKRAIWASTTMPDHQALEFSWELLKSHWRHPDFAEGPRAFLEQRSPIWNPDPNARG